MEQTPSLPGRSPELPSVAPLSGGEVKGGLPTIETTPGDSLERQEQSGASASAEQAVAPPPLVPSMPLPAATSTDDDNQAQPLLSSPTIASDDDLIEKEWVEKAKKVLVETKDDPYRREQEVSKLQADYLLKRYGRELGSAGVK